MLDKFLKRWLFWPLLGLVISVASFSLVVYLGQARKSCAERPRVSELSSLTDSWKDRNPWAKASCGGGFGMNMNCIWRADLIAPKRLEVRSDYGQVKLSWEFPPLDAVKDFVHFRVYRDTGHSRDWFGGEPESIGKLIAVVEPGYRGKWHGNVLQYQLIDDEVDWGKKYNYYVTAYYTTSAVFESYPASIDHPVSVWGMKLCRK